VCPGPYLDGLSLLREDRTPILTRSPGGSPEAYFVHVLLQDVRLVLRACHPLIVEGFLGRARLPVPRYILRAGRPLVARLTDSLSEKR
jgi:hypothetical protein